MCIRDRLQGDHHYEYDEFGNLTADRWGKAQCRDCLLYTSKAECNLQDGLLVLPSDSKCTGVAEEAFDGIEEDVRELFIPKNITYIAPGALNRLSNLVYIQVMDGNPAYYSEKGCLYNADGNYIAGPLRKNKGAIIPEV